MSVQFRYCCLFALLFLSLSHQTFPQTHIPEKIQFKYFAKEEVFAENWIWRILQDHKGFIWTATNGGLVRYEGQKYKVYKHSSEDPNSLGANSVYILYEDKSGTLWAGTGGGGLNRYNSSEENFTRYVYNPKDTTSISSNYVMSIYEDKSGTLWIGTDLGLNIFDRSSEKFIHYKNDPKDLTSISSNVVTSIYEDSKNNIWIGTNDGGLNKFDPIKSKFTHYLNNPNENASLSSNRVTGICESMSGDIWISTFGGGLNKLSNKDDNYSPVFKHFVHNPNDLTSLSDNNISSMYIDPDNIMWLGTWGGGLNRTMQSLNDNSSPSFISYKHDPDDPSSLSINNIRHIYQDKSGLFWIATWAGRLHLFDAKQKQFKHYKFNSDDPFSLSANAVLSIYEDRSGIIWIGTWDGGLNKWDRATNKFTHYKHDPNNPNSLSDNTVSSIYEDTSGILWVGTWNGGLNKFDRRTGKFYHYRHDPSYPKSISDDRILSIAEDESGILWIGTYYGGLNRFEKHSESFSHFRPNPDYPNSLSSSDIHFLFIDNSGTLWIGTKRGSGLNALDLRTEKLLQYKHNPKDLNSLSNNKISSIYEDKSGTLWVGTQEGGLNKLDRVNGQFRHFKMENGLPGNFVSGILEDDYGNLWISTTNGLSKFNPQTETFRNYDVDDGLQSNEFEELTAFCKSKTGELLFGGVNGFNIFFPDSIKDNTYIPPVYITDFYLFNKPVTIGYDSLSSRTILSKSIIICEEIELNYDDKVFSFEFAALDYHAPMKNKYAYKMEGFDKDWTFTDASRNLATYTNLNPGEYTFRVKGSNNDGVWNETGASLKIIILPPWYQTTLAFLIYILLIGSILSVTWKTQLKRIKNKHEYEMSRFEAQKLHEVDQLKSHFFANISHEFRTPLTLILGPSKQLIEKVKDEKANQELSLIHKNAKKLLALVNQLLDISKLESGNMKLLTSPQNIVSLMKALVMSFASYAERKKINLKFNSTEGEITVYIDWDKFEKIITNIMSNAFKFTPEGGNVEVTVQTKNQYLNVNIIDTGVGIPKERVSKIFDRFYQVDGSHTREHEGTGIGLSLTKELVELHKGKIEVESEEGKGTSFTVSFPLGKEHLKPEEIVDAMQEKVAEDKPGQKQEYEKEKIGYEKEIESSAEFKIDNKLDNSDTLPLLLIVEDNSDVRNYIKENLKQNYRVLEAEDGEDGWNKSIEQIPELIVSDVMMPKMDGFKLCEKLKTDERTSHIPVILLTAKASKEDKLTGYETGADEYLMKPFEPDELRARIKNLIEQRKRLHKHFKELGILELNETEITSLDKKFMQQVYDIISNNISNQSFGLEMLAENLSISRSLLHKKMFSLTGESPGEFIRRIRLNKASNLIENNFGNISEIALEVGFSNPAYFSEAFKRQFGVPPSQYQRNSKTS